MKLITIDKYTVRQTIVISAAVFTMMIVTGSEWWML